MQLIGYQIVQITEHKINITHRSMLDKLDRVSPFLQEVMTWVLEDRLPSIGLDFYAISCKILKRDVNLGPIKVPSDQLFSVQGLKS